MEDKSEYIQYGVRLTKDFLKRIDKLAEQMSQPGIRITRAEALRVAAHRGAELLEAEKKKR
jgi:predicted transcriptional regulator